ncbi:MAG: hypothetical protein QW728_06025 [Thermoplasmata archaeon]
MAASRKEKPEKRQEKQPFAWTKEELGFLQEYMLPENLAELTREKLILGMIKKHSDKITQMKNDLERSKLRAEELKPLVEEVRRKRDELNKKVYGLKEERDKMLKEIRTLKRNFFNMIDTLENIPDQKDSMKKYKEELSELDFKLQTEGITIEDERRIMGEIKNVLQKINSISRVEQEKKGMQKNVEELTLEIAKLFGQMQKTHEDMLQAAQLADAAHNEYQKLFEEYANCLKDLKWVPHRIELSQETLKYWMERLQGKNEPKKLGAVTGAGANVGANSGVNEGTNTGANAGTNTEQNTNNKINKEAEKEKENERKNESPNEEQKGELNKAIHEEGQNTSEHKDNTNNQL